MSDKVIWLIVCLICAACFAAATFWASKSKEPVHLFGGDTINSNEIKNVKRFNLANAVLWAAYCVLFIIIAIAGLISLSFGIIMMILAVMPGLVFLIIAHRIIYMRYKVKHVKTK